MTNKEGTKRRERLRRMQTVIFVLVFLLCGAWSLWESREEKAELLYTSFASPEQFQGTANEERRVSGNSARFSGEDTKATASAANADGGGEEEVRRETKAEYSGESETEAEKRVNLNTATPEELQTLPGIGPATAKLIVEYRAQYGGFAAIEEIQNVKRIGAKTFEKLRDKICV